MKFDKLYSMALDSIEDRLQRETDSHTRLELLARKQRLERIIFDGHRTNQTNNEPAS